MTGEEEAIVEDTTEGEGEELAIIDEPTEETEGEEAIVEETTEETGAEGEPAETEPAEAEAAGDEAAPAEGEVTSTTVLEAGAIYTVENDMPLYAEASTGSEQLLTLLAGYQVAVLEPAEAGNGWHNVRVWLGGGTTDGYIQIP